MSLLFGVGRVAGVFKEAKEGSKRENMLQRQGFSTSPCCTSSICRSTGAGARSCVRNPHIFLKRSSTKDVTITNDRLESLSDTGAPAYEDLAV